MIKFTMIAAVLALGMPARAALDRPSSYDLYLHARAASTLGDTHAAGADFTQLLARAPGSDIVRQRAYREALTAGDFPLALRAAHLLDSAGTLPPDGRLLTIADAVRARDWKAARAQIERLQQEKVLAFLAPALRAWVALGARDGDPLALLEPARALPLARPYVPEQHALLLLASGRIEDGIAALRAAATSDIAAWPVRSRLVAADTLAGAGQRARALGLLDGDEPPLVAARARLAAGKRLPAPLDGAGAGIALLLARVASELARQQLPLPGLALGRDATLLNPRDGGDWLLCADLLGRLKRPADAIVALQHVGADDPFDSAAHTLRVALLSDMGDHAAALADARRATETADADAAAWARLGDVYLTATRPQEAAAAYAKALAAADAAHAGPAERWPLYLQQGSALDLAGDWPGAKAALGQALKLAPDQPLVLNQLGYSQIAHRDDVAAGSALIARANSLRPDDPAITDSLGWARFLQGQVGAAVPLLEKASAADPGEATINEHLGDAYWAVGRDYEARYSWRAALVTAEDKDRSRLTAKIDNGYTAAAASP